MEGTIAPLAGSGTVVRLQPEESYMTLDRNRLTLLVAFLTMVAGTGRAWAEGLPPGLPRYEVALDLDLDHHEAHVHLEATWTNPSKVPVKELIFNAHSHY